MKSGSSAASPICTPQTSSSPTPEPSEAVAQAIEAPELRLPQVVQTVIDGYADRPALGQRAVEFVTDPTTGRTSAELLPRFDTITYRELSDRVKRSRPR